MRSFRVVLFVLSLLCLGSACAKPDALKSARSGDLSMVCNEPYHGHLAFLYGTEEYSRVIEELRQAVEKEPGVLDRMTAAFFDEPHRDYVFKYGALDRTDNFLVLRYFARVVDHPLIAGYQVQLAFDIGSRACREIYVSEVPLE